MAGGVDATGGGAGAIEGATATAGEVGAVARMHPAPAARMSTMLVTAALILT